MSTPTTHPFAAEVEALVAGPHQQSVALDVSFDQGATWVPLDVTAGRLSWAERRTPRVLADVTVSDPGANVIAALDPRLYVLGRFTVSYLLPNGSSDSHVVFTGHLRERDTRRPANELRLAFASKEMLYLDATAVPLVAGLVTPDPDPILVDPVAKIAEYLAVMLWEGGPGDPPTIAATNAKLAKVEASVRTEPDTWAWLEQIAEAADLEVFDEGDEVMRIQQRPRLTSTSRATFTVGATSTLLDTESRVTREDFVNRVTVQFHSRADGPYGLVDNVVYGTAAIESGPYAPASAGWCQLDEDRQGKPSQAVADLVAANLLRLALSRSRGLRFAAVSHWWLRPGMTVTVQLPAGDEAHQLVSEVEFDIAQAVMDVTTRYPDFTTDITIGE